MGWKKGAAAGAAAGSWAGPLGMAFGAIVGGTLQHMATDDTSDLHENEINHEGLSLKYGLICIGWENIAYASDSGEGRWDFWCKGGLDIEIEVTNSLDGADEDELAKFPIENTSRPQNINPQSSEEEVLAAAQDLLWALDVADRIRGGKNIKIDEEGLFRGCVWTAAALDVRYANNKDVGAMLESIRKSLRAQFSRIDAKSDEIKDSVEQALIALSDDNCDGGIAQQKEKYEELCTSIKYSIADDCLLERKDIIAPLLSKNNCGEALGAAGWYSERKTIICTNLPMSLKAFSKKKRLEGIMIMDAADIILYNEIMTDQSLRLTFQPGPPQNGCTYVQHPFRKNVYYEINSYHDSVRERKQNELLRILEALGAYSARVEVRHEQQESANVGQESSLSASGSYKVVKGSASYSASGERQSSTSSSQSATKDWTFNPPEKPYLPDDLVFYPTEETWQLLANSALRGGLKRAVVDLEYKSEYGITEKYLLGISASVKSLVPSFEMDLKQGFTSNLHRLATTQWHYEVVFENEAGERAGANNATASTAPAVPANADTNKVELLFAKRAKRYAQSEGHINAEQRTDLEAFAQKYGIDEFRMEELIEEAFE